MNLIKKYFVCIPTHFVGGLWYWVLSIAYSINIAHVMFLSNDTTKKNSQIFLAKNENMQCAYTRPTVSVRMQCDFATFFSCFFFLSFSSFYNWKRKSSFIKSRDLFDFETVTELKQHKQAARITCVFCFKYYLNIFNCNYYSRSILSVNALTKVNRFYFHKTNEKIKSEIKGVSIRTQFYFFFKNT